MAYKVKFTMTRPSTDVVFSENLAFDNDSDVGTVPSLVETHGGTIDRAGNTTTDLSISATYTFPDQDSWQAFYNAALPVWNRNNLVEKANNSNITIDVSVVENT